MYLREIWVDPRLRYPDPEGILQSIPVSAFHKIWTPDLFFNERDGKFHNVQKSNRFARIFANGKVSFNSRYDLYLIRLTGKNREYDSVFLSGAILFGDVPCLHRVKKNVTNLKNTE